MHGTEDYYAKWNKPGGERQIPYDVTYKWNLMNEINEQNRTRGMETYNRLTAIREEGGGGDWLRDGEGNICAWPMNLGKGVGIDCGSRGWAGWGG